MSYPMPQGAGTGARPSFDDQADMQYMALGAAVSANVNAAGELLPDTKDAVLGFLSDVSGVVSLAHTVPSILPMARYDTTYHRTGGIALGLAEESWTEQVRVREKPDAFTLAALDAKSGLPAKADALNGRVGDLVAAIYADAAAPAQPNSADHGDVADRKADLTAMLESLPAGAPNPKAQQLIQQAVREKDDLTLYVLLGGPMRFVLDRLDGVKLGTLQTVAANARIAASPGVPAASRIFAGVSAGIPGVGIIRLLATAQGLDKLPDLANAYASRMLATVKSYLLM